MDEWLALKIEHHGRQRWSQLINRGLEKIGF
jgi:hypothetical protein